MDVLLVAAPHLEEPGRVRAFLRGWRDALPELISRQDGFPAVEELVCPLVLDDDRLARPAEFRDALLDETGPMATWRAWLWGEASAADEAANARYEEWRAERWPPADEMEFEAGAAVHRARGAFTALQTTLELRLPESLVIFLAFFRDMPEDAAPAWRLLGLQPCGLLSGELVRSPEEPPEFFRVLDGGALRLGLVWDHPQHTPSGVGAIRQGPDGGRWWAGRTLLEAVHSLLPQVPVEEAFSPVEAAMQRRMLTEWLDTLALADHHARSHDEARCLELAPQRWCRASGRAGFGVLAPGDTTAPTDADVVELARRQLQQGEPALALMWGRDQLVTGTATPEVKELLVAAYRALGRHALADRI